MPSATNPSANSSNAPRGDSYLEPERKLFINKIALTIILISAAVLVFILVLAATCYKRTNNDNTAFENIKTLLGILLPVIGTWMGTILAFYFSKENFEAANKQIKELVKQVNITDSKLQVMNVTDVMIKASDASVYMVDDEASFKNMKLLEMLKIMNSSHSQRMPILQKNTLKFIFLIYASTIERFLLGYKMGEIKLGTELVESPPSPEQISSNKLDADLTVNDMFKSNYELIKNIIELNNKQHFIPISATLEVVKQEMQDNTICQDVFITQTGSKNEAVEGWITNNLLIEKAELFRKAGA